MIILIILVITVVIYLLLLPMSTILQLKSPLLLPLLLPLLPPSLPLLLLLHLLFFPYSLDLLFPGDSLCCAVQGFPLLLVT